MSAMSVAATRDGRGLGAEPPSGAPTANSSFAALLSAVRPGVDTQLATWLAPRIHAAEDVSVETGRAAKALAELALRGGKRLRAALVAAGFAAVEVVDPPHAGGEGWAICEPAMLAIELLQAYLLIHDDWMDNDAVRRGGPAVHVVLGPAGAILAGDLACGYAQEALLESKVSAERLVRTARVFARIQTDVVTGQIAEMNATHDAGPSVERVHSLKTASYTVTGPLLLGATLGGADDMRCAAFERFGRPLGVAFQMRDDVLGVFGDPRATGKPIWNDIRQGKRTALVAELAKHPDAEPVLARALGKPDASEEDLRAVVRLMEESGSRARVEARVRELCDEARRALDAQTGLTDVGRGWLMGAISALGERTT